MGKRHLTRDVNRVTRRFAVRGASVVETPTDDGTEPDEWFFVNLTDATNATLSPHTQGIVKIGANDS